MTSLPEWIGKHFVYTNHETCGDRCLCLEAVAIAWEALEKGSSAHEAVEPDYAADNFWKDLAKYNGERMLKAMRRITALGKE